MHHETIRIPKNGSFWASPDSYLHQTCLGFPFLVYPLERPSDVATVDTSVSVVAPSAPHLYRAGAHSDKNCGAHMFMCAPQKPKDDMFVLNQFGNYLCQLWNQIFVFIKSPLNFR